MSTGEFEVMYLLEATSVQAAQLRRDLEHIGDSVGVVGTPDALGVGLYQVHVHTDTPVGRRPSAQRRPPFGTRKHRTRCQTLSSRPLASM